MPRLLLRIMTIAVAIASVSRSGAAQIVDHGPGDRTPSRPTFGPAGGAAQDGPALDLTADLEEGYDQNLAANAGGLPAPTLFQSSGYYATWVPGARFASTGRRVTVDVNTGGVFRYYPDFNRVIMTNYFAGAGVSAQATNDTSLVFNQGVTYAPAFLYGLFAREASPTLGESTPAASDYIVDDQRSYVYTTRVGLTHKISSRSSVSVDANLLRTDFVVTAPGYFNQRGYSFTATYTNALSRRVNVRMGYTFRSTQYAPDQAPIQHSLDLGIDYTRPLSRTRQFQFGVNLSPTLIDGALGPLDTASRRGGFIGDGFVDYPIARTWHMRATYQRTLNYVPGLSAAVYSDGASAKTTGFFGRNTMVSLIASYALGTNPLGSSVDDFRTYSGEARLQVGLTRNVAATVDYLYYRYAFDANALLPPSLPLRFTRNSARVGLSLWASPLKSGR